MNLQAQTPGRAGLPVHEQVYRQMRDMILFGAMQPGQAVTIQGLVAELDAGMTPVREALRRLTAEGALEAQGNRRICVPVLSKAAVDELTQARLALEIPLAERACLRAGSDPIAALRAIDQRLDDAIVQGDIGQYLVENHAFHHALYALSDAPILTALVDSLWLRFGPSLRVVCGQVGTRSVPDQHKALINALSARNCGDAGQAMRRDIEQGMAMITDALPTG